MAIWQTYVFGHLHESGELEYFKPYNNGLKVVTTRNGRTFTSVILNPTEKQMNNAGWYRVINVEEDGTDNQVGNIIYHYVGEPYVPDEEVIVDGEETNEPNPTENPDEE